MLGQRRATVLPLKRRGSDVDVGDVRERGSATVLLAVALVALLAGSAYVVATSPQRERARPVRASATAPSPTAEELDKRAQGAARNAIAAAQTAYTDLRSFGDVDASLLRMIEPSVDFTSEPSDEPGLVSVAADGNWFGVATRSASGTCWWMRVNGSGDLRYGSGEECIAPAALIGAQDTTW
jgi:hypothetical protein